MVCDDSRQLCHDVVTASAKTFLRLPLYQDMRQAHPQPRVSLASQLMSVWWVHGFVSFGLRPVLCSASCQLALHPIEEIHRPKTVGLFSV